MRYITQFREFLLAICLRWISLKPWQYSAANALAWFKPRYIFELYIFQLPNFCFHRIIVLTCSTYSFLKDQYFFCYNAIVDELEDLTAGTNAGTSS